MKKACVICGKEFEAGYKCFPSMINAAGESDEVCRPSRSVTCGETCGDELKIRSRREYNKANAHKNAERYAAKKEYYAAYRKTEAAKRVQAKYRKTAKRKASYTKFQKSEKGRKYQNEYQRKYQKTEKAAQYRAERFQVATKHYQNRYRRGKRKIEIALQLQSIETQLKGQIQ